MEEDSLVQTERGILPIPAYTSLEVADKLRFKSENRYINEQMESELESYKGEIERRFENSQINKGYAFPRVLLPLKSKREELSHQSIHNLAGKENSFDGGQSPYGHFVSLKTANKQ